MARGTTAGIAARARPTLPVGWRTNVASLTLFQGTGEAFRAVSRRCTQ